MTVPPCARAMARSRASGVSAWQTSTRPVGSPSNAGFGVARAEGGHHLAQGVREAVCGGPGRDAVGPVRPRGGLRGERGRCRRRPCRPGRCGRFGRPGCGGPPGRGPATSQGGRSSVLIGRDSIGGWSPTRRCPRAATPRAACRSTAIGLLAGISCGPVRCGSATSGRGTRSATRARTESRVGARPSNPNVNARGTGLPPVARWKATSTVPMDRADGRRPFVPRWGRIVEPPGRVPRVREGCEGWDLRSWSPGGLRTRGPDAGGTARQHAMPREIRPHCVHGRPAAKRRTGPRAPEQARGPGSGATGAVSPGSGSPSRAAATCAPCATDRASPVPATAADVPDGSSARHQPHHRQIVARRADAAGPAVGDPDPGEVRDLEDRSHLTSRSPGPRSWTACRRGAPDTRRDQWRYTASPPPGPGSERPEVRRHRDGVDDGCPARPAKGLVGAGALSGSVATAYTLERQDGADRQVECLARRRS